MDKKPTHTQIRNPFAGAIDEKAVWKQLSENARPASKEELLEKVRQLRKSQKDT
ncbi:hypothetical protein [Arsenicibacter rosenii]|uniref:hypothetical protein n=1 Tax=Arsenicibacter rosenii TaxID=1750698 RepID=UPI0015A6D1FE|nr:hypothetical protein [Arsenicibacter rosenii]